MAGVTDKRGKHVQEMRKDKSGGEGGTVDTNVMREGIID